MAERVPPERIAGTFVALMRLLQEEEQADALAHARLHYPGALMANQHDYAVARCQVECPLEAP